MGIRRVTVQMAALTGQRIARWTPRMHRMFWRNVPGSRELVLVFCVIESAPLQWRRSLRYPSWCNCLFTNMPIWKAHHGTALRHSNKWLNVVLVTYVIVVVVATNGTSFCDVGFLPT